MMMKEERQAIYDASKLLFEKDYMQYNGGNISIRDPKTNLICIKPSGRPYTQLRPEDLIIIDLDGNVVEGDAKPSYETPMHTLVYKSRPDINAVVHSHAPYATAWSTKGYTCLRAIVACLYLNKGAVRVAPYEQSGSIELAKSAVKAMGDDFAAILQNHGIICAGPNIDYALATTLSVEDAAKVACIAESMGGKTFYIDEQLGKEQGVDTLSKIREEFAIKLS